MHYYRAVFKHLQETDSTFQIKSYMEAQYLKTGKKLSPELPASFTLSKALEVPNFKNHFLDIYDIPLWNKLLLIQNQN